MSIKMNILKLFCFTFQLDLPRSTCKQNGPKQINVLKVNTEEKIEHKFALAKKS